MNPDDISSVIRTQNFEGICRLIIAFIQIGFFVYARRALRSVESQGLLSNETASILVPLKRWVIAWSLAKLLVTFTNSRLDPSYSWFAIDFNPSFQTLDGLMFYTKTLITITNFIQMFALSFNGVTGLFFALIIAALQTYAERNSNLQNELNEVI